MNKSIFKKIKKVHHSQDQYPFQSHYKRSEDLDNTNQRQQNKSPTDESKYKIVNMSVDDMQRTLLTQIQQNKSSYESNPLINSASHKKVPELMFENQQLKDKLQKLKDEKKLIISKYEQILIHSNDTKSMKSVDKNSDQFSFRNSNKKPTDKQSSLPLYVSREQEVQFKQKLSSHLNSQKLNDSKANSNESKSYIKHKVNHQIPSNDSVRNEKSDRKLLNSGSIDTKLGSRAKRSSQQVFSSLQQRFYQYCKTQMIRMNTQNKILTQRIGQLQSKLTVLDRENQIINKQINMLKQTNEKLEVRLQDENQRIYKLNNEISLSYSRKQQLVSTQIKHLQQKILQLATQQQKLSHLLNEKDNEIQILKDECIKKSQQYQNYQLVVQRNIFLQNQLNYALKYQQNKRQRYVKTQTIDHLWQIKEVQYANIINLLNRQKIKSSNVTQRNYQNGFDLSFSKNSSKIDG